jgi:hypothetical protein
MTTVTEYTIGYIRRALTMDKIEPPELGNTNGDGEILESIYSAHRGGGAQGARDAWQVIKRLRPELAPIEGNQSLLIHASELKDLTKPELMLDGYPFFTYGFNILAGPSGSAKSFTALDFSGRFAQDRATVYVVGEGLHGYAGRWEALKDFYNLEDGEMYFHKEPVQFANHAELETFAQLIKPKHPQLIVVDTFARCAVGVEENSARDVGIWVDACDSLRRELNCGVLVVHHTGKQGNAMRGSSALYGAADCVLMQRKIDGRIIVSNDSDNGGKNKHQAEAPTRYMKILPHNVDEFEGAVLVEAEKVIETPTDRLSANQRTILETIEGYQHGMSAQNIVAATTITQPTAYRNLKLLMKAKYVSLNENEKYILTTEGEHVLYQ